MITLSTIDIAEPGREVERAAEIFAQAERGTFPPQALVNLRMAIELTMIVVPQCSRHQAERAVIDEFFARVESMLDHDAGDVVRQARASLAEEFPTRN